MIKRIQNVTDNTLSINLFGHLYEIPTGWSLLAVEVWGGEETLRYIACKMAGKVLVFSEDDEEVKEVLCPACNRKVNVEVINEPVVENEALAELTQELVEQPIKEKRKKIKKKINKKKN